MIKTPFWYSDISILYSKDSITEIFPSKRFDILRKLNAIVRLSIFYTIILYFMRREQKYLVLFHQMKLEMMVGLWLLNFCLRTGTA